MNGVEQYQNVQVMTADGVRLIIMLYEGVVRFNNSARLCMEKGDVEGRSYNINRSFAIVSELANSLDMEQGGEVAENLARLYEFSAHQLTTANAANDPAPLESVNRVFEELKAGWEAIAADRAGKGGDNEGREGVSYGT